MKSLVEQLSVYASYHRDGTNKAIHAVFVPLIVFSAMGLLTFPLGPTLEGLQLTPALLVSALVLLYYLMLDFGLGVALVVVFTALLAIADQVHTVGGPYAWWFFGIVFAVSWVAQVLGHSVWEGRKPALLDNLFQVLIAPLFVASEACYALGLRKRLREEVEKGLQDHLPGAA